MPIDGDHTDSSGDLACGLFREGGDSLESGLANFPTSPDNAGEAGIGRSKSYSLRDPLIAVGRSAVSCGRATPPMLPP
jgi:hypothetical protein